MIIPGPRNKNKQAKMTHVSAKISIFLISEHHETIFDQLLEIRWLYPVETFYVMKQHLMNYCRAEYDKIKHNII